MKRMLFILPLLLMGCGIQQQMQSRQEADASLAKYRSCLADNERNPDKCEGLRLLYEANQLNYESKRGAGITGLRIANPASQSAVRDTDYTQPPQIQQPRMWMENRGDRTYQCNDIGGTVNCN